MVPTPRLLFRASALLWLAFLAGPGFGQAADTANKFDSPKVAFQYLAATVGAPSGSEVPACPFEDPSDKPDGISPEHFAVVFRSGGPLPEDAFKECNLPNFDRPEIRVFPIDAFVKVDRQADSQFANLRRVLQEGAVKAGTEVPFVPFVDAHPAFVEHVSFFRFQNGNGFAFLTQWMIEADSIGKSLVYVFQGTTDDGRSYVFAAIPVKALATLEPFSYRKGESYEDTEKRYETYASRIAARVRGSGDTEFLPELIRIREMLASIVVK